MEVVKNKEQQNMFMHESYEFNEVSSIRNDIPFGILFLYSSIIQSNLEFVSFSAETKPTLYSSSTSFHIKNDSIPDYLPDIQFMVSEFVRNNYVNWKLDFVYMGVKVEVVGENQNTKIKAVTFADENSFGLNLFPVFSQIEKKCVELCMKYFNDS